AAARTVLAGEGFAEATVNLAFVDNPTSHRLNRQFLHHDEPTDVITFPLNSSKAECLEGELVIGAEIARAQAAERGHAERAELALYVIHGILHLCGYDDHSPTDRRKMRARERHYLMHLGLPNIVE